MHLSFLKMRFSQYAVELHSKDDSEWAYIKNKAFEDVIKVYYDPEDYDIYCLVFATQHIHISKKEELLDRIAEFAYAERAATSFFRDCSHFFIAHEQKPIRKPLLVRFLI